MHDSPSSFVGSQIPSRSPIESVQNAESPHELRPSSMEGQDPPMGVGATQMAEFGSQTFGALHDHASKLTQGWPSAAVLSEQWPVASQ
jgi:hypothetical protein